MDREEYMSYAMELAKEAYDNEEVPVGCIITDKSGNIIGRGRNRREENSDATAHAEIEAIREACSNLGDWRLNDCSIYVTLEPCPMCAGAIINSRVKRVVFGAGDKKAGAFGSVYNINDLPLNHKAELGVGVMQDQCQHLLSDFFKKLRGCIR